MAREYSRVTIVVESGQAPVGEWKGDAKIAIISETTIRMAEYSRYAEPFNLYGLSLCLVDQDRGPPWCHYVMRPGLRAKLYASWMRLYRPLRSLWHGLIRVLEIWGLASIEPYAIPSWRDIGRRRARA